MLITDSRSPTKDSRKASKSPRRAETCGWTDGAKLHQDIMALREDMLKIQSNDWEHWQAVLDATARCCNNMPESAPLGLVGGGLAEDSFNLVRGCLECGPLRRVLERSLSKSRSRELDLTRSGIRAAKAILDFLAKLPNCSVWTSEQLDELRQWRKQARKAARKQKDTGTDQDPAMPALCLGSLVKKRNSLERLDQQRQRSPSVSARRGISGWVCPLGESPMRQPLGAGSLGFVLWPPPRSRLYPFSGSPSMSVRSTSKVGRSASKEAARRSNNLIKGIICRGRRRKICRFVEAAAAAAS